MRRRPLIALAVAAALGGASFASFSEAATRQAPSTLAAQAAGAALAPLPAPRSPSTADRYAPANGCWSVRSGSAVLPGGPFRFQAFDLGKYLLIGKGGFLATAEDPLPVKSTELVVKGFVVGQYDERVDLVRDTAATALDTAATVAEEALAPVKAQVRGDGLELHAEPSASAEWVLARFGGRFALWQGYDDGEADNPGPLMPPIAGTVVKDGDGFRMAAGALRTPAAQLTLVPARGCPGWTESGTGVTGKVPAAATPYGPTQGYLDAHMHLMAQEFLGGRVLCGRVTHPYGITKALEDCPDHQAADGRGAVLEDFLAGYDPGTGHDPVGWPTFGYWPNPYSLTHQGAYHKWLERTWRGGLRMLTVLLVENGQLCQVYPLKRYECDEMESVRREALRVFELQRYIDAQAGGPGRGFLRVVTDPFQARRVVNQGRLAIVLGIEVSRPLGCREYLGTTSCTDADVEERMAEVHAMGVRQMEMTNKFDNAFTGVTGDSGTFGVLVGGVGNVAETGHDWKMGTCKEPFGEHQHDRTQANVADESGGALGRDALFGAILETTGTSGVAPLYPAGPHCNTIGLTGQGRLFLEAMVKRGMVFDPDHMSAYARQAALDLLQKKGYSGVVSSHSWADDKNYHQVLRMGGVVTPYAGGSSGFLGKWQVLRRQADPRFTYGVGYGSDINGFGSQGGPRNPAAGKGVSYPFRGLGGVTVQKLTTGQRTWDVNKDGVAHYGLYPDWIQDVAVQAGRDAAAFKRDMANGSEAYLQMWERALGVAGDSCRRDVPDLTAKDRARAKRGMTPEQVIAALGQPHTRADRAFTYCGTRGTVTLRFTSAGRLA